MVSKITDMIYENDQQDASV